MAQVRLYFNDGTNTFTFPLVQSATNPEAGTKDVVIEGVRADGSIVIPGGKKSTEITIRGIILHNNDGYSQIIQDMNAMRTYVTNRVATLSQQHWNGSSWVNDWSYTVKRIGDIDFGESLEYLEQQYTVRFLILSY
jgi:hypothetical protein